jgi:TP901 family phage tail tape measure protein
MAREPELSIKVKVDPQIKPSKLKTDIEGQIKKSGEKPQIDIDPNVDGIKKKVEDKLKNIKATANITPIVDTEKLKTDIQQQINGISDMPKVNIGVNVDDFSSELTKQLKDQLKEVNQQLSYYLKNLTSNTDRLGSFVNDIFPTKELKTSAKQIANEVSDEFTGGLSKAFNINNLLNFKNSDKVHKRTLSEAKNLASQASDLIKGFVDTKDSKYWENGNLKLEKFNEDFLKLKSTASSLSPIIKSFMSALESNNEEIKSTLDIFNKNGFNLLPNSTDIAGIAKLLSVVEKFANISFNEDSVYDFTDALEEVAKKDGSNIKAICDGAVSNFTNVQRKVTEINSNIKQTRTEIKDVQKEANTAQKTDTSGHLDASTIETYGQKLDKVLSTVADKQNAINDARKTAVDLEKSILAATVLTREGLSNELTQYEALFKKFDTDKIAKFAETTNLADFIKNQEIKMQAAQNSGEKDQIEDGVYNVKKVKFDIDPAVLQANIDAIFENVSAPIRLSLAPGTIDNLINEITPKLNNIQININNSNSNNGVHFKNWPDAVDALLDNAIDDTMRDVGMGVLKALELDADHSKALKKLKETYGFDKIIKDTDAGITAYFLDDKTGYDDIVEEASKWYNNYIAQIQKSKPVDVKGKVTITDADVVVDVKNPVAIPGTVTVNPTSVQFGNSDDLQKNASALSSVKQSLSKISTNAEGYGTKIAAIGPSVQYVTQEVDNLSKSLENQITDLDLIAKKTDAYGTTANSVTLSTKDVAVTGDPVDVPVKATLKKTAITVPEEAVDIKVKGVLAPEDVKQTKAAAPQKPTEVPGHVTLSADDIVAPTAPVDIPGKVTLKVEDVTPPKGSVKIPGKVELKVSDITPPKTAVELEGKVSNVTVDDTANGKKKNAKDDVKKPEVIDLKGKVELEDKDIKRPDPLNLNGTVKIKAADVKIDDVEISKKKFDIKGNLILKNAEIVDAVKEAVGKESKKKDNSESTQKATTAKKKSTSRRGLISELTTVNKKIAETRNKLEDVSEDESGTIQKRLEDLKANRTEIIELLNETNTDNDKWYSDRKFRYANKEVAYTRLRHTDSKSVKESQENIQAAQNERDKYNNEKLSAYRAYRSEQNTYKLKKARFGEDEKSDEAIAINNAISELDTKKKAALNSMKLTIQEHADLLDQMGKEDNEVEEKVNRQISIIKGHESNKNKVAQTTRGKKITDQLSAAQKTYGTEEEANAIGKIPTSVQKALSVQQQLVDKIAKAKIGTEEYNNAIQAAEENWKSVVAIIDTAEKKQKDLTKAVDSIEKKFYQLAEEVSGSSNEKLKNSINGVITKAATLSAQNPNTYENYAVDYNELKRESYKANAQYTIWKSNYKKLEREGIKIAEGVEVARQMQADGSLQNVKFDGIDNLLKQLNELEPQTDAYKEKLVEVKKIWEEIERKVKAVEEAEKQAAKRESTKAANLTSVGNAISQNRATMKDVQKNYGTDYSFYGKLQEKDSKLKTLLDKVNESSDPVSAAKEWAKNNLDISPDKINSVTDAINQLNIAYREATQEAKDFNKEASRERSINKASMEVANLKATIHDYIAEHKKLEGTDVGKSLYELLEALNQSDAPEKIGELKKKYAELRAESKKLGLESKNLLDMFEKLFGQHLSTMITMAALHQIQNGLRVVYQNVVEIDTAITELRKVSEYTGKSLEEYMGRAAEQAQKLGVSISDYVNSTADWKRLGYSDEDAENLATYSTLLRNVGDGIDDVNTSSSYLISTLQGFGLLADQAEDVVNKIDAVANTQPVTANDLGEILTRSSAAMSAANNTLEETIALGTAANAVIQDADTVGTTLKSLSMYLRAAKSDAKNAGIEVDGMANSVSELRSELKSLTGVDIMLDSKNFKSTYQIMKELSQVWSGLSDVTQANVTEMIGGKRNANAVSAILNNFDVAESAMESAANSANVAWEENEKYLDSIQGRLAQLDASFQALSQDVLSSDLVKTGVSFLTSIVKLLDQIVNLTGALPLGLGISAFVGQLGKPKMTGFMIVPSNTPGGDTEQARCSFYWRSAAREYLVKPTNMVA